MSSYFFCLGRILPLCELELKTLLGVQDIKMTGSTAWVERDKALDCDALQWASGGTIKCGNKIGELPAEIAHSGLVDYLSDLCISHFSSESLVFGLHADNAYSGFDIHTLLTDVKKSCKEKGRSVRFVEEPHGKDQLSSARSLHQIKACNGLELVLGFDEGSIHIGKVVSVQDIDEWSHHDFGRPARRIKDGMLPPKLARMMINIGLGNITIDNDTPLILDPFCGSGTILYESSRIGAYCSGIDISPESVQSSQANLQWFVEQTSQKKKPYSIHPFFDYFYTKSIDKKSVRLGDATHLHTMYSPESIDLIVTEPYMGKLVSSEEQRDVLNNRMKGLEKLYIGFLKSASKVLKKNGVIVFTEPFFLYNKGKIYGRLIDKVSSLGYNFVNSPIEYQREFTNVGRRVLVMKKE
jgi:tRNA G10  N-methylase Trm11